MRAKKSLGQHFLKSEKALAQIIDAGDIHGDDLVLEIGPGKGALTERLSMLADKVIAVEKDSELVAFLKETFARAIGRFRLDVIERDILKFDPETLRFYRKPYKLIANIPYYITGAIIEKFLSAAHQPTRMVLLIQKEVAERIVAKDGKESVLSIAVRAYGTPRIVARVPAGAFIPAPKVDSAIISIEGICRDFFTGISETLFFTLLKFIFGKKRKQIAGSLSDFLGDRNRAIAILAAIGIDTKARPERLALTDWKLLTAAIERNRS